MVLSTPKTTMPVCFLPIAAPHVINPFSSALWSKNLLDTDKAMDSFFTGCAEAGPHGCPFWAPTPDDIYRNLTKLYDNLRSHPRAIKTETKYGIIDYSLLRAVVFSALYSPYASFKFLADGLADLAAGKGAVIFDKVSPPPYQCKCDPSKGLFDGVIDAQTAILCNDGDDVPGDLKSSEDYFKAVIEGSSWSDIWARIRLGCV